MRKLVLAVLFTAMAFACGAIDESVFEKYTDSAAAARLMLLALTLLFVIPAGLLWAKVFDKFGRRP